MYNLSTHKETRITTSILANYPQINGDRIVWVDGDNNNWDIYMYNLSTHKETRINTSRSAEYPQIYGDRIVWVDVDNKVPLQKILIFKQNFISTEMTIKKEYFSENMLI